MGNNPRFHPGQHGVAQFGTSLTSLWPSEALGMPSAGAAAPALEAPGRELVAGPEKPGGAERPMVGKEPGSRAAISIMIKDFETFLCVVRVVKKWLTVSKPFSRTLPRESKAHSGESEPSQS